MKTEVLPLQKNKVMKIAVYQVDAFADEVFRGNPAAVCPLPEWLEDRASERGGQLDCRLLGDRVELIGSAILYMNGEIYI